MQQKSLTKAGMILMLLALILSGGIVVNAGSLSVFLTVDSAEVYSDKLAAKKLDIYVTSGSTADKSLYYEVREYYDAVTDPWLEGRIVTTGIVAPGGTIGTTYFNGGYLPYTIERNYAGIKLSPYDASSGAIGGAVLYNNDSSLRISEEAQQLMEYVDEQVRRMDEENLKAQEEEE